MRKKTLIIGAGQIGKSLNNVLCKTYDTILIDKSDTPIKYRFEAMHVCFPYFGGFESEVKRYRNLYKPELTIIHSTVPVGTSKKCEATHSPVRGIHPNLESGIKTFIKFVGGKDADDVAEYFRRAGLRVQICRKSETTELAKILSTTRYGIDIEVCKETERLCDRYNVPFSEVYTLWTETYNNGYQKLNHPEYTRPTLQPIQKKIGGHCVEPNLKLIKTKLTQWIQNKKNN